MKFKNYVNAHTGDNRIYSFEDIIQMPFGDVLRNKEELLSQNRVLGVPTVAELQSSQNVVYVNSYTREDGTVVKSHYRSKPDGIESNNFSVQKNSFGTLTGGASKIIQEIKEERDVPEMTKSAERQENMIKNMPIWEVKMNPEQEYYRLAFELKKSKENGKIPEWINEHNDVRTLDKIGNEKNKQVLKSKIIQGAKDNNDIETLINLDKVYVVTVKSDSKLTTFIENNEYLNNEFKKKYDNIVAGKYKDSYFSLDFPESEHKIIADYNKDFSIHNTLGRCDVHNVKVEPTGEISAIIIDYYDFDKHNMTTHARNAYLQQQNGRLSNYAIMIPIRIKLKK